MKTCHVCGETFEDYVEVCSDCGAVLKTEEEMEEYIKKQEEEQKMLIKNPVLAESVDNVVLASVFEDMLNEAEVPFFSNESGGFHAGFGGNFFSVDFFVDEKNLAIAQQIFENAQSSDFQFDDQFDDEEGEIPESED